MSREFDALMRLEREDLIPLKKARPLLTGTPSVRTLQRYVKEGYRCPILGQPIHLEAFRGVGRSWWTSRQAIRRFLARKAGEDVE